MKAKNAADSWLKECEGFTMCAAYHVIGDKIEFELNFAGSEQIFASGNPIHRRLSGKMANDDCLSFTWDNDATLFPFEFIHNSNRQPTSSDSLN
jgi:hypothetical protein